MQRTYSLLRNRSASVRLGAVKELDGSSSVDASMLKVLSELLQDADPNIRMETAKSLGRLGADTVPVLIEALSHADTQVRREAAAALGKLGPAAEPAVAALVLTLRDTDGRVRMGSATALGQMGAAAEAAVPHLILALGDSNMIFCRLAAQALSMIGPAAVEPLTEALRKGDASVRREAAWALGQLGPAALAAVPVLNELLNGRAVALEAAAAEVPAENSDSVATAVFNLAPAPAEETKIITDLASPRRPENDAKVRDSALQALERIRGKSQPVL